MVYYTAMLADTMLTAGDEKSRDHLDDYLGLFTPILKGFLTETGLEASKECMQVTS